MAFTADSDNDHSETTANPDAFVDEDPRVHVVTTFDDMPLNHKLIRGIYSNGFETPSPIQQRTITPIVEGHDVIGQARSGTGKTGAFSIGTLQRLDWSTALRRVPQALVLSPTRELAQQTYDVMSVLGEYLSDGQPFCHLFVGGTKVADDVRKLQAGTMVAVGTPGRVTDLVKRGMLRTGSFKIIVLDEADELLSQGFAEQVVEIFRYVPRDVQIALFSATMPPSVLELSGKFMRDPICVLVRTESLTLKGIKQFYVAIEEENKLEALMDLYESVSVAQSVIFANTRRKVDYISARLNANNHTVSLLHAEMPKGDRDRVMRSFRSGSSRVLVATDVVARGIDVHHVNIVVNYDLPDNIQNYLHRIGRSGRYGRKGVAINFVSHADRSLLRDLEGHYRMVVDELPMNFAEHLAV